MNDKALLEKYTALVAENKTLKKENERLRAKLRDILPSQSFEADFPAQSDSNLNSRQNYNKDREKTL
ncbi:MAG: hypothetical protein WC347_13450 [Smithellaceae bacterium]|jgi:regulator of replication initiation timing